jgi:monofunctional biosynthetic peptidoglycan transglycosylase
MRRAWIALIFVVWTGSADIAHAQGGERMKIVDFAAQTRIWQNIDDVVMGGVSSSTLTVKDGVAAFSGTVSFDNNGGFASVRSPRRLRDLSGFDGLVLRVRGDGKMYGFRVRTDAAVDGVSYQALLGPPAGEWTDIEVSFDELVPVFRGRRVFEHPPLDPTRIATLGFIISRQEGPFRLEVANIRAYRNESDEEARRARCRSEPSRP